MSIRVQTTKNHIFLQQFKHLKHCQKWPFWMGYTPFIPGNPEVYSVARLSLPEPLGTKSIETYYGSQNWFRFWLVDLGRSTNQYQAYSAWLESRHIGFWPRKEVPTDFVPKQTNINLISVSNFAGEVIGFLSTIHDHFWRSCLFNHILLFEALMWRSFIDRVTFLATRDINRLDITSDMHVINL